MPQNFYVRYNKESQTPETIFTETHKELVKSSANWLDYTSQSCSVVASLFATVAFNAISAVPGGLQENTGSPKLEHQPAFNVFAISSLIALYSSVIAVVVFVMILTSGYKDKDFGTNLLWKLLLGFTMLFVSTSSTMISFCAGHFFLLKDKLKSSATLVYMLSCTVVLLIVVAQFPLYFRLLRATLTRNLERYYLTVP